MNIREYLESEIPAQPFLEALFGKEEALVIFDIGACEGEESIRYSRLFPNARILAFEPLPSNADLAEKNLAEFDVHNVQLKRMALSDEAGELTFYVSSGHPEGVENTAEWDYGNKSSSLLPPTEVTTSSYAWLKFEHQLKVAAGRMDEVCRTEQIDHVDYMHMDVQGAELKVLEGAGTLLQRTGLVWLEVAQKPFYENQPLARDVYKFMRNNGFRLLFRHYQGAAGDHLYISEALYNQRKHRVSFSTRFESYLRNLFHLY